MIIAEDKRKHILSISKSGYYENIEYRGMGTTQYITNIVERNFACYDMFIIIIM